MYDIKKLLSINYKNKLVKKSSVIHFQYQGILLDKERRKSVEFVSVDYRVKRS